MGECAELVDALERRLDGNQDLEEAQRLDRHLADCDACRKYLVVAKEMEATLLGSARHLEKHTRWDTSRARVQKLAAGHASTLRTLKIAMLVVPAAVVASVFVDTFSSRMPSDVIFVALTAAGWPFLMGGIAKVVRQQERIARDVLDSEADLIPFFRKKLDREIAGLKRMRWSQPLVGLAHGIAAAIALACGAPPLVAGLLAGLGVVHFGAAIYAQRITLPARIAERAELA